MQSKKIFSVLLAMILAVSFISCTQTDATGEITSETDSQLTESDSGNTVSDGTVSGFGNNMTDGTNVIEDRFDDNTPGLWGTYSNGGDFELYAENGEIVVDIKRAGSMTHSVQIFRDGFPLNMNCVYTVSFDIYSDIERDIEWRFQINGGDYHAYYEETEKRIGPTNKR